MTVDEVKILLSDLNRGYNTPYSSAEQATIERLYYEVLGKHLNGCRCPDKWHDAVLEINSYIKKHGKMKEKSNYKLRAGVILQIAGSSEIYTNDNLTDEVAAAFLKEHPNAAGRFEVIPTAEKDAEAPKAGGNNGNTADDAIRQAIAAELVAGKSKTAIKQELAGKEIGGVKLTHRLISDYIEKITAEE